MTALLLMSCLLSASPSQQDADAAFEKPTPIRLRVREEGLSTPLTPERAGQAMDWPTLYETIGREDLARSYEENAVSKRHSMRLGTVVLGIGGAVAFAGVVLFMAQSANPCLIYFGAVGCALLQTKYPAPDYTVAGALLLGGLIGAGVGLAVTLSGAATDPQPVSEEELRRLVMEYNAGRSTQPQPHRVQVSLAPQVLDHGGGLSLRLVF